MKFIITENQVNNLMFDYINWEFTGVRPFTNSYGDDYFLWWRNDDGVVAMYDVMERKMYILDDIWNRVKGMFNLEDEATNKLLMKWVKKYLKIKYVKYIRKGAVEMNGWFMYGGSDITEN
jgi:hypothetical protein